MDDQPLAGFRIGVTAARKVEEQVALLERRGARGRVGSGTVARPQPRRRRGPARGDRRTSCRRPVDLFLATTGIGMKTWFAACERWGMLDELLASIGSAEILARGPKSVGALRRRGLRELWAPPVGVLRGRPRAPARPRPRRAADRGAGARPVAVDGRPRAATARCGRHGGDRLPGGERRRPGADVQADRPDRRPGARRRHLHLRPCGGRADGCRRRDRPPGRGDRAPSRPTPSRPASGR